VGFGSVDPNRPDALERLARFPSLGLRGLKLHPTLQGFDPGDARFEPFFDAAAELGLIVLTHAGTSGLGAGEPGGQGLRIDLAQPIAYDRIAARHPRMPVVLAHVGWPWHLEALAMALHKTNVILDISGWKYRYLPEEVRREMTRRLRGQVCFGTDYPMFDPEACLEELAALGLGPEVERAILHDNSAALLGLA
jgi:predicted TIM-barrel fold metal-dependent hydrolase